ncbi:MAG: PDZ domain-containing protein, partial [Planctomycetota bacterium]
MARPDDADLKQLLAQFVCVRVVQGNDADLSLFQFDYDATFAAFFLHADRTIYGRFGTRSAARDGSEHVTSGAFQKALRGALELHAGYPGNRAQLAGKSGELAVAARPAELAALRRYDEAADFAGGGARVDASCIHCHQLGTGLAQERWQRRLPLSDEILFPWPMPDVAGFTTTIEHDLTVATVVPASAAANAGLRPGDEVTKLGGQPLLSLADLQWVLHRAPASVKLPFVARRGTERVEGSIELAAGWRRPAQRTWRMS